MKALVIGAGFGGMAASLRLAARGYQVTVVDRCARAGGRAQIFERGGYRHDAGPTVITAPFLLEELFALHGERMADHLDLRPLDPWYRFVWPDGEHFDYGGTPEQMMAEIARFDPADQAGYKALLAHSRAIFDKGFTELADRPFHRITTMLAQVPALVRLGAQQTVWQFVSRHIRHPKLREALSVQPLLVGGNPFSTTSIYALIHYLEREWGIHFAMGGTGAIVDALTGLMQRAGIALRTGVDIDRLIIEDGEARGAVTTDGEAIHADITVSNADPAHLYKHMIPAGAPGLMPRLKARHARFSMGLFVLFFGTDRTYPDVAHHTIWLGRRYRELLADIFDRKTLADDFSLYLHRPTATDPSFAPPGHDSFYVLAPVPNLQGGQDWSVEGPRLQERIVRALSASVLPDLEAHIREPFFMSPEDFSRDYRSEHGAGFSIAPHFTQSAWFRFHNRGEGIRNLFLTGAGTHPGAGLPGVLSSARVLDHLVPRADADGLATPADGEGATPGARAA